MKATKKKEIQKQAVINKLITKASLDFRCCGHGGQVSIKK